MCTSAAALALAVAAGTTIPAHPAAAASLDCDEVLAAGAVRCVVGESWIRPAAPSGSTGSSWPPEGWRLVEYPTYGTDDGEPCLRWVSRWIAPGDPLPVGETAPWFEFHHPSAPPDDEVWPDCPPRVADTPPARAELIEHLATVLRRRLPPPDPGIAPDARALTGLPAHLDTGPRALRLADVVDLDLDGRSLSAAFAAAGRYTVDWGSGTASGPYDHRGGAYPDGGVVHVYRDIGAHEVALLDTWDVLVEVAGVPPLALTYDIGYPPFTVTVSRLTSVRAPNP